MSSRHPAKPQPHRHSCQRQLPCRGRLQLQAAARRPPGPELLQMQQALHPATGLVSSTIQKQLRPWTWLLCWHLARVQHRARCRQHLLVLLVLAPPQQHQLPGWPHQRLLACGQSAPAFRQPPGRLATLVLPQSRALPALPPATCCTAQPQHAHCLPTLCTSRLWDT